MSKLTHLSTENEPLSPTDHMELTARENLIKASIRKKLMLPEINQLLAEAGSNPISIKEYEARVKDIDLKDRLSRFDYMNAKN